MQSSADVPSLFSVVAAWKQPRIEILRRVDLSCLDCNAPLEERTLACTSCASVAAPEERSAGKRVAAFGDDLARMLPFAMLYLAALIAPTVAGARVEVRLIAAVAAQALLIPPALSLFRRGRASSRKRLSDGERLLELARCYRSAGPEHQLRVARCCAEATIADPDVLRFGATLSLIHEVATLSLRTGIEEEEARASRELAYADFLVSFLVFNGFLDNAATHKQQLAELAVANTAGREIAEQLRPYVEFDESPLSRTSLIRRVVGNSDPVTAMQLSAAGMPTSSSFSDSAVGDRPPRFELDVESTPSLDSATAATISRLYRNEMVRRLVCQSARAWASGRMVGPLWGDGTYSWRVPKLLKALEKRADVVAANAEALLAGDEPEENEVILECGERAILTTRRLWVDFRSFRVADIATLVGSDWSLGGELTLTSGEVIGIGRHAPIEGSRAPQVPSPETVNFLVSTR